MALAEVYDALGRTQDAAVTAERAVKANELDDGIHFLAARTLVDVGQTAKAQQLAADLNGKLQQQTKAMALMINADIAVKQKRVPEAIEAYREARKLHDSWISHYLLGMAYVEANHFPEALTELETAEKRSSEAADLFDSNTTSLRYLPPVYYWLGRAQEGLGASEAARKSYQRYIAVRANASADSADKLFADAKRRTAP